MRLIVGRQFPDLSPNGPRAKRKALLARLRDVRSKLSPFQGQFVAIHLSGFCVAETRDEADSMAEKYSPRVVVEI